MKTFLKIIGVASIVPGVFVLWWVWAFAFPVNYWLRGGGINLDLDIAQILAFLFVPVAIGAAILLILESRETKKK